MSGEFIYVWVLSDLLGEITPTVFARREYAQSSLKLEPGVGWRRARADGGLITTDGRWRLSRHPVVGLKR